MSPKLEQLLSSDAVPAAMQTAATEGRDRAVLDGYASFNPRVTFENGRLKFNKAKGGAFIDPDLHFWDLTQRALRDAGNKAEREGAYSKAEAIFNLHHELLAELDERVPEFGAARGTAAKFFKANDASEAGANFVTDNSIGNPEAARQIAKNVTSGTSAFFARAFAGRLADLIEAKGDTRNVA